MVTITTTANAIATSTETRVSALYAELATILRGAKLIIRHQSVDKTRETIWDATRLAVGGMCDAAIEAGLFDALIDYASRQRNISVRLAINDYLNDHE